jgi:Phytanoyl-CoA dioxygenase (PhyH)
MADIRVGGFPHARLAGMPQAAASGPSRAAPDVSAAEFARHGFLSIASLTTLEDLELVRSLLDPLFEKFDSLGDRAVDLAGPRAPGTPLRSPEVNEAVILEPRLRETVTFARCREIARQLLGVPVGYQFDHAIFKPPHNKTPTAWHQDEAYSREPIPLRSAHFWIPLQAATEKNGCMWFIPGSNRGPKLSHHLVNKRVDGANRPTTGGTLAVDTVDDSTAVPCPLAAGGATVHHPLTLHYTGANESDAYRKVWILHFGAYGWFRRRLHPKVLALRARKTLGFEHGS